jgi:hypothetical protein
MKKASEYRQHAEECRVLARGLPDGEQRNKFSQWLRIGSSSQLRGRTSFGGTPSLHLKESTGKKRLHVGE